MVDSGLTNTSEKRVYNKRPEITAAYFKLRERIDAVYVYQKKIAPWSTVIAALNDVIKDYNDLVASRGSQDSGTNTGGTTTPPSA